MKNVIITAHQHDQLVGQDIGDYMEARTVLMQEPRLSTACSDPGNIHCRGERDNEEVVFETLGG